MTFQFFVWVGVGAHRQSLAPPPAALVGRRVLVVDDVETARESLTSQLGEWGVQAFMAATAADAWRVIDAGLAAEQPVEVVLLDWQLGDATGDQVAREILARSPETRVVVVTAYGREDVRRAADAAGVVHVLTKPLAPAVLQATLCEVLGVVDDVVVEEASQRSKPLAGVRVLVVEDNEINRQIAIELLDSAGAVVEVACDGREAVSTLTSRGAAAFDVVLMDLQMPVLDGYGATRELRADERFGVLPIVAMTAHAFAEERERCLSSGMNDHITKPIDPDALVQMVLRWGAPERAAQLAAPARVDSSRRPRASRSYPPPSMASAAQVARSMGPPRPPELVSVVMAPASASVKIATTEGVHGVSAASLAPPKVPKVSLRDDDEAIDTAMGLKRTGGKQEFYAKMLAKFVEGQADVVDRLMALLGSGQRGEAERLAHTVKGVSANLGMTPLSAAAGDVEGVLRTGGDVSGESMSVMRERLAAVIERAREALGTAGASSEPGEAEPAIDLPGLVTMLRTYDGEAAAVAQRSPRALEQALGGDVAAFRAAIAAFDLDVAADLLEAALSR